jgi:hypothetical protein
MTSRKAERRTCIECLRTQRATSTDGTPLVVFAVLVAARTFSNANTPLVSKTSTPSDSSACTASHVCSR